MSAPRCANLITIGGLEATQAPPGMKLPAGIRKCSGGGSTTSWDVQPLRNKTKTTVLNAMTTTAIPHTSFVKQSKIDAFTVRASGIRIKAEFMLQGRRLWFRDRFQGKPRAFVWHCLSNATCLRPDLFYTLFVLSRSTIIRQIIRHF